MRPHMLDETVVLPDHAPQNTIADYRDYCIGDFYSEPYSYNGKQTEKVFITISLRCAKEGQEGYQDFDMEFVQIPHADWKLIRFDVQEGSKPVGEDAISLSESTTAKEFFASSGCQELQCAAFNFINALYTPNFEELRQLVVDPSWVPKDPNAWGNRSRDDCAGYGITWVSFAPYTLDGKEVLLAYFHLSMFRAVPGEEGIQDPLLRFVYVDNKWKVLDFDYGA